MRTPIARWTLLSRASTSPRSSHCLSISKDGILAVYGGELKPRTPTDARVSSSEEGSEALSGSVHTLDLKSTLSSLQSQGPVKSFTTLSPSLKSQSATLPVDGDIPTPRVGASTVFHGDSLYLWGGRGGVDMAPLPQRSAGPWKAKVLTDTSVEWERLTAVNEEDAPEPRSYHVSVVHNGKIYIHAGCPTSGRLTTLHSFDLQSKTWKQLADAPGPGRGGTALTVCALPGSSESVFLRFGGFAGYELPTGKDSGEGSINLYSPSSNSWTTLIPSPDPTHGYPGSRSVHGLAPIVFPHTTSTSDPTESVPVAVVYHGERDASSLGHAGAGTFWDDVWTLCYRSAGEGSWEWKKADVVIVGGGEGPEARGWFPSASWAGEEGKGACVVLQGGLISSNERVGDAWALELDL